MIGLLNLMSLIILCTFINVGEMGRFVPNPLSTFNGAPEVQPVPNLIQQMALNSYPINQNPFGQNDGIVNAPQTDVKKHQESGSKKQNQKNKKPNKNDEKSTFEKGIKVGGKVKLMQKQKLRSGKSKHLNEKKGRFGMFLFWAFMLVSLFVPQMPQNVMLQHNNQFVPIESQYLSCHPITNGMGYQCEFSVDQLAVDNDFTDVSIWANLDNDNSTIELLGKQDMQRCEAEEGHAYCGTRIEVKPEQIGQLQTMPIADTKITESINGTETSRRKLLQDGSQVQFTLVNNCAHKIYVSGASQGTNIIPQQALDVGTSVDVKVPAAMSSCRLWPETDCDQKPCDDKQAAPTVSLFEWTFDNNGQTYDVSYVDAANVPISVYVPKCADQTVAFNDNLGNNINNLYNAVPGPMRATDQFGRQIVKSPCQAYGTPEACCTLDHNQPQTCGPVYSENGVLQTDNGMSQDEVNGLNAMQTAFPTSYSYAYDDKRATKVCRGADHFVIGFCGNCNENGCSGGGTK